MSNQSLILALYQIGAIQFGEFKLKSGVNSSVYLNLRKIISYPLILRQVAHTMWGAIRASQFDLICGVPYTALPIATCIALEQNFPMVMRRKEKKEYGTKQMVEGEFKRGQRCLIVEDVITSGSSIIETAQELENAGLIVNDLVVLIDREQGGRANLAQRYQLHSILSLSEILQSLLNSNAIDKNERTLIKELVQENC